MATAFGRPVPRSLIAFLLLTSTVYAVNLARSHNCGTTLRERRSL
jgi:hypothetical protein